MLISMKVILVLHQVARLIDYKNVVVVVVVVVVTPLLHALCTIGI